MTGIIILAAGASSRLGSPKQNLVYEGESLLQRNIKAAVATGYPVTVILGANAEIIRPTISHFAINIIYNDEWQEGIASSIRLGIGELKKTAPHIDGVILMLCDQPFVSTQLLLQLTPADASKNICACTYNGTIGPPAFFDDHYFPELQQLTG
ncbi:MAG: nucleotidyltransferase family protein, partial [Mucilaginibacter sp.]